MDKGLPREDAYKIVQRNAGLSWDQNQDFRDLLKSDEEALAYLNVEDLNRIFDYSYYTRYVDDIFSRVGLESAQVSVTS